MLPPFVLSSLRPTRCQHRPPAAERGPLTAAEALWPPFPFLVVTPGGWHHAKAKTMCGRLHESRQAWLNSPQIAIVSCSLSHFTQPVPVPVFFDEVARLLAPGGYVVVVSSLGLKTPFHTPERTLRNGFRRRGVEVVAGGAAGPGTFFLGRLSSSALPK